MIAKMWEWFPDINTAIVDQAVGLTGSALTLLFAHPNGCISFGTSHTLFCQPTYPDQIVEREDDHSRKALSNPRHVVHAPIEGFRQDRKPGRKSQEEKTQQTYTHIFTGIASHRHLEVQTPPNRPDSCYKIPKS